MSGGENSLTCSLALFLGAYFLLSAAGVLVRRDAAPAMIAALRDNPAVAHVTGAVAFFVGAGLLLVHCRWLSPAQALVSAVAVWWMIEGGLMLALGPRLFSRPDAAVHFRRMNLIALPVGLALVVIGLIPLLEPLS